MVFIIAFILQEKASQKRMQRSWKKQIISKVKEKKQGKKNREKEVSYIIVLRTSMAGIFVIYNFLIYTVLLFIYSFCELEV